MKELSARKEREGIPGQGLGSGNKEMAGMAESVKNELLPILCI